MIKLKMCDEGNALNPRLVFSVEPDTLNKMAAAINIDMMNWNDFNREGKHNLFIERDTFDFLRAVHIAYISGAIPAVMGVAKSAQSGGVNAAGGTGN